MYYERFFNKTAKAKMVEEFMNLKQNNMIVVQYESHFDQLWRFVENMEVRDSNKA